MKTDKLILISSILTLIFVFILFFLNISGEKKKYVLTPTKQKQYAGVLIDKGLYLKAINEYERLIDAGNLNSKESSNLYYIIGNIYLENLHDYENALAIYEKAKILNPSSDISGEIDQKIIECLERTGKSYEARKQMDKLTLLDKKPEVSGGTVVAKIGNRTVTMEELERKIKSLPSYLQVNYNDRKKQFEFLKNYVATELLFDAAKRRGYERDTKINEQIEELKKAIMVQKLLEEEAKGKIDVSETEIKLYYDAHRDEFVEKKDGKKIQKTLGEVRDTVRNIIAGQKFNEVQQNFLEKLFKVENVAIYEDVFMNGQKNREKTSVSVDKNEK